MKWDCMAAAAAINPSVLCKFALSHLFFCLLKGEGGSVGGGLITRIMSPPLSPPESFASACFLLFFLNDSSWQDGVLRRSGRLSRQRVSPAGPRAGSARTGTSDVTRGLREQTHSHVWHKFIGNRHLSRFRLRVDMNTCCGKMPLLLKLCRDDLLSAALLIVR